MQECGIEQQKSWQNAWTGLISCHMKRLCWLIESCAFIWCIFRLKRWWIKIFAVQWRIICILYHHNQLRLLFDMNWKISKQPLVHNSGKVLHTIVGGCMQSCQKWRRNHLLSLFDSAFSEVRRRSAYTWVACREGTAMGGFQLFNAVMRNRWRSCKGWLYGRNLYYPSWWQYWI